LAARDALYENIMEKSWNKEKQYFGQSFENTDVLDSAVLIMPLVFFMHAVRMNCMLFSTQLKIDLVRSAVCEHSKTDSQITGKRWFDV
jgi:hypothetical protein